MVDLREIYVSTRTPRERRRLACSFAAHMKQCWFETLQKSRRDAGAPGTNHYTYVAFLRPQLQQSIINPIPRFLLQLFKTLI